jgi:uncharacterized protein involved in high-affinity Fe2+ transport
VPNRWAGVVVAIAIAGAIAGVLLFNLESRPPVAARGLQPAADAPPTLTPTTSPGTKAPFREYPIGEDVERNSMTIAAVWLPAVHMAGEGAPGDNVIHLEADIHATEGNPNGFARDEFIPYLTVTYTIEPKTGGPAIQGTMLPMVARDGMHYGAQIVMPGPGSYLLRYRIEPPSTNGLGRHDDPLTGVQPWWEPFDATYEWDFQPPAPR